MTAQSKTTIKTYFETNDRPTQAQFVDFIDSYQDVNSTLTTLASASVGAVGLQLLATATSAAALNIIGAVNKTGDTMTGALNVPASATGTQVPRAQEVVAKGGDTMTGKLNLLAATSAAAGLNVGVGLSPASPTNGDVWVTSSAAYVQVGGTQVAFAPATASQTFAQFQDQKTAGTSDGAFSSGSFVTRTISSTVINNISGASLASNQITLPAGTYYVETLAPGFKVNRHISRFRNVTDSTTTLNGLTQQSDSAVAANIYAVCDGQFTIAGTKTFELQHQCQTTNGTDGFGQAANLGVTEIYADVKIWKIG